MTASPGTTQEASPPMDAAGVRRAKITSWRKLQAGAGLLLASAFFMPAVDGCNDPIYPSELAGELFLNSSGASVDEWLGVATMVLSAYVFGALVAVPLIHRRKAADAPDPRRDPITWWIGATAFALFIALAISHVDPSKTFGLDLSTGIVSPPFFDGILLLAIALSFVHLWRCLGNAPGGSLCLRWYGALCCVAWFIHLGWDGSGRWGLGVALAAAIALLVGATAEAMIASDRRLRPTLSTLASARWRPIADTETLCRKCGYNLFGLVTARCPECGEPFGAFTPNVSGDEVARNSIANSTTSD